MPVIHQESFVDVLAQRIEQRIRELLTFRPAVTLLPFGSLPRTGGKTKLIEVAPQP